jgi:hypothetical protein
MMDQFLMDFLFLLHRNILQFHLNYLRILINLVEDAGVERVERVASPSQESPSQESPREGSKS